MYKIVKKHKNTFLDYKKGWKPKSANWTQEEQVGSGKTSLQCFWVSQFLESQFLNLMIRTFEIQKKIKDTYFIKHDFCPFLNLKFHFGHQKWTSQIWCLEIDLTVTKDSRAKKRFSVLRMTKKYDVLRSNTVENYKNAILGHPQHRKSFFGFKIFRNGRIDF